MATPHVVGVVSLMLSVNPSLTPAQVTTMLQSTATPFPAGSTLHDVAVRRRHRQRRGGGRGGERRRRRRQARRVRQDLARESGLDRRHVGDACSGARAPDAASYSYCVDTVNDDAVRRLLAERRRQRRPRRVSGLAPGTNYYWQVQATNAAGDTVANGGAWWTFATQAGATPPAAFSKTSPANGARNQGSPSRSGGRRARARPGTSGASRRSAARARSERRADAGGGDGSRRGRRTTGRCTPSTAPARPTPTAAPGGASGRSSVSVRTGGARLRGEASASPGASARASARSRRSACSPWCRRSTSRPSPSRSTGRPRRPRA